MFYHVIRRQMNKTDPPMLFKERLLLEAEALKFRANHFLWDFQPKASTVNRSRFSPFKHQRAQRRNKSKDIGGIKETVCCLDSRRAESRICGVLDSSRFAYLCIRLKNGWQL